MALYTGINAYTKVEGASGEAIIKTSFYTDYRSHIEFSDKFGGYPKFHCMLDFLDIEDDLEDTEENYNMIHSMYSKEIKYMQDIVDEINKYNLLDKVKSKEIAFITRNYKLARKFGEILDQDEFYFRKFVTYDELVKLVEESKSIWDLSWTLETAKDLQSSHVFEIHVS